MDDTAAAAQTRRRLLLGTILGVLVLGFAFQGSRGIWEPDEGFYTNAALGMLSSGDWLVPRLNGEPFLDKPPLTYWAMALAMRAAGVNEWSARAPHSLWFAATALLVAALAARWWGWPTGVAASAVYAVSLAPFLAANVLTPDTPLAFAVVLAYYAFCRLEETPAFPQRMAWALVLGVAIGLGGLAKGPAMLIFLPPMALHAAIRRRSFRRLLAPEFAVAGALAVAIAAPWYATIGARIPGAAAYMFDNQVAGRLYTTTYGRNSGPLDGFAVYLHMLLLGSLPWSVLWFTWFARSGAGWREIWRRRVAVSPEASLLSLWLCLPLAVLMAARSRLPLYALPLFAPLALLTARRLCQRLQASPATARPALLAIGCAWLLILLTLKGAAGLLPLHADARHLAQHLAAAGVPAGSPLVVVDSPLNGLAFYGFRQLEQVTTAAEPYPFYAHPEPIAEEVQEVADGEVEPYFLVGDHNVETVIAQFASAGLSLTSQPLTGRQTLLRMAR